MKFINSLKERFTKEQLMIIATALSLSTPFYICVPFLLLETLYLLYTKKIINAFKSTPKSKYLIIFMLLTLAISLIYQNWIGVGCVALIFIFVSLMLYYRQYINEDTFEFILDMLIALSILWAIYGLFEQIQILDRLGYDHFTLKVFSRRENRLNSVFFNANYYAMMIEFTIMMIGYKIFGTKNVKKQLYYFIVACLNFFLLYMTGCRTAFVATAGAMYGYYKNKEALFNDIVEEVSEEFKNDYLVEGINLETIDYIYQNFEVFKLIICCSKGTRYEEYLDCLVNEKTKQFNEHGFDDKLSHIINHSYLFGVFEIVRHQMTEKQAEDFVSDLQEFYQAGWNKLLERKEI